MNNNELTAFLDKVYAYWTASHRPSKRKVRRQRIDDLIRMLAPLAVKALNRTMTESERDTYNNLYQEYKQLCDEQLADEQRRYRKP